jgi:hypothetical protein
MGAKKLKKRYSTPTGGEELKNNQKWDSHYSGTASQPRLQQASLASSLEQVFPNRD